MSLLCANLRYTVASEPSGNCPTERCLHWVHKFLPDLSLQRYFLRSRLSLLMQSSISAVRELSESSNTNFLVHVYILIVVNFTKVDANVKALPKFYGSSNTAGNHCHNLVFSLCPLSIVLSLFMNLTILKASDLIL